MKVPKLLIIKKKNWGNELDHVISIKNLNKTFNNGVIALKNVSLDINEGEILALLGPNGAGKTTLISIACGLTYASSGQVYIGGYDIRKDYKAARRLVGLVPQEIALERYENVLDTVHFSRGLFGLPRDNALVEKTLRLLYLWDKRGSSLRALSGGMKRRVLFAKALVHEPTIIFLDEPSAGVDVEVRKEMWGVIKRLRDEGTTVILTTHYIEEAQVLADRIAIINDGMISLIEEKDQLIKQMGDKKIFIDLSEPCSSIPSNLKKYDTQITKDNKRLVYICKTKSREKGIGLFLNDLHQTGLKIQNITTKEKTLEEIFMSIVQERKI